MNDYQFESFTEASAERRPLSVSELNTSVRAVLESEFSAVWVEGEVVNFVAHSSGHWYFNLKDGKASVKCVCWKGTNFRIRYRPENGNVIRVRGKVTLWETAGSYQLQVESLEPAGEGALLAAFEQIRAKLGSEGLLDQALKRPLPFFPRRVGVVTARNGAAFHDIMSVLTRRARSVSVIFAPALVQGEGSADSIRHALEALNEFDLTLAPNERIDVIIVGRGGGSAEDLWAFNDERLARAIRASAIPVISAVGHEIDNTIADEIADLRAGTPSIAAEMVAAREEDLMFTFSAAEERCTDLLARRIEDAASASEGLNVRLVSAVLSRLNLVKLRFANVSSRVSPATLAARVSRSASVVDLLRRGLVTSTVGGLRERSEKFSVLAAKLDAMSPLKVLNRGFSITEDSNGRILRDPSEVKKGDRLKILLEKGKLDAEVV